MLSLLVSVSSNTLNPIIKTSVFRLVYCGLLGEGFIYSSLLTNEECCLFFLPFLLSFFISFFQDGYVCRQKKSGISVL